MIVSKGPRGPWFLSAGESQMVVGLAADRWPVLVHWGLPINSGLPDLEAAGPNGFSVFGDNVLKSYTPNRLAWEYPGGHNGDFRSPAYEVTAPSGPALDLAFTRATVLTGFPDREGLPGARAGGEPIETLLLTLDDPVTGLGAELRYTPVGPAVVRSVRLTNRGQQTLTVEKACTFSLDLHPDRELDIVTLDGAWARERQLRRFGLPAGRWEAGSRRGVSSHQAWPGVVLAQHGATEASGEVWGAALVWSGDWTLSVERDEDGGWRLQGGLHREFLSRRLRPGESFVTPEAVLVHAAAGLSDLSAAYHQFVRQHLLPPHANRRPRPVVVNNWEATYFSFTEAKLSALADAAVQAGIEVFVLDDGWFGNRDSDRSSLGDWQPHRGKFPGGLTAFAQTVVDKGLRFGLWFEPEAVSPDSGLYREHPDWCLHLAGRERSESRHELLLNLSLPEVRSHLHEAIAAVLSSAPVTYVKWDMNRPFSHAGVDRYDWTRGLYALLDSLSTRFPEVQFEGCCGGGGRMDFGLLHYVGQYWTSDNTDAVARLTIQEGTSLFLPPVVMGTHVSAVPNHQTGRTTTWGARVRVASAGTFGWELDLTALSDAEKGAVAADTAWFQAHRNLIHTGRFRRTRTSLEDANTMAWQVEAQDGSEALLWWFRPRAEANPRLARYRWQGLDAAADYEVTWWGRPDRRTVSGSELLHRGLVIPLTGGDADGAVVHVRRQHHASSQ